MSKVDNEESVEKVSGETCYRTTWGKKLFWGVFALLMVFFWWLLIYSGGVEVGH